MKIVETRCHDDEVSGVYLLDDGRQVYWTEGRSSDCRVLDPSSGGLIIISSNDNIFLRALSEAEDDFNKRRPLTSNLRPMTPIEMAIYDVVRNFNPNGADEVDIEEHPSFTL